METNHIYNITYLEFIALCKKSCQDMSPSRNFMLKLEPLVGITIAVGDCASTTLLQNRRHTVRHTILELKNSKG